MYSFVSRIFFLMCFQTYSYKRSMEVSLPVESNTISLGLYLAPSGVIMKREVLVFDTLEMIGNVGGYLGLLLGWSVMSLVELCFKDS